VRRLVVDRVGIDVAARHAAERARRVAEAQVGHHLLLREVRLRQATVELDNPRRWLQTEDRAQARLAVVVKAVALFERLEDELRIDGREAFEQRDGTRQRSEAVGQDGGIRGESRSLHELLHQRGQVARAERPTAELCHERHRVHGRRSKHAHERHGLHFAQALRDESLESGGVESA
jgi:hypothetical protein